MLVSLTHRVRGGVLDFCKDSIEKGNKDYTGCFVGVELGVSTDNNVFSPNLIDDYTTAPKVNVSFGWQWYYWDNAGFRIKGFVGYADYSLNDIATDNDQTKADVNFNAIQYGVAIAWHPYNFIFDGGHTLGLHIEEGVELSTIIGSMDASSSDPTATFVNLPSGTRTISAFTSSIGVHYFYKINHQFSLDYRYRPYGLKNIMSNNSGTIWLKPSNAFYLTYSYMF